MKKSFIKNICTLSLTLLISMPVLANGFPIADGIDILADEPNIVKSYVNEFGRSITSNSRDFNSPSFSIGVFLGNGMTFGLNEHGFAEFTNIDQSAIDIANTASVSYQILNPNGGVINGRNVQGNITNGYANPSSSLAANQDVQAFLANANGVNTRSSGTFHW